MVHKTNWVKNLFYVQFNKQETSDNDSIGATANPFPKIPPKMIEPLKDITNFG